MTIEQELPQTKDGLFEYRTICENAIRTTQNLLTRQKNRLKAVNEKIGRLKFEENLK